MNTHALILLAVWQLAQFAPTAAAASPIDPARLMGWGRTNLGVRGGIPSGQIVYTNIVYTGAADYGPMFRSNISNCPSNQVVKVFPGDYTVGGDLDWEKMGNGQVLRGSGDYRTKIRMTNGFIYVRKTGFDENMLTNSIGLSVDALRGTNRITVSNVPSWMVVGGCYILDHISDTNLVYGYGTSENENPAVGYRELMIFSLTGRRESRGLGCVIKVTNIIGSDLYTEQPINVTFEKSRQAQITMMGHNPAVDAHASHIGFEDLTFEQTYGNSGVDLFRVEGEECWWRGCTLTNSAGLRHIQWVFGYRNEVQNCWIDRSHFFGPGQGYGVALDHDTTACIVENSVLANLHSPLSFAYGAHVNAVINTIVLIGQSDSGQNPAFNTHGVHCYGNLAEGCYFVNKVLWDFSHGSASHNGLYKTRVLGYDSINTADQIPVIIEFYNHSNFVAGSALGVVGFHTNVLATATNIYCDALSRDIYHLGFFTFGCGYGSNNFDAPAVNQTLLAVNWDAVTATNSGVVLGGYVSGDLPASLVYGAAPAYWPAGRTWPIDLLPNANAWTNLPAFDKLFARTNNTGPLVVRATATTLRIR